MINKVLNEPVYDDDAVNKKYVDEQIEKVKENSVTKEDSEIKEDNVYSTEETIVGKWIDGKPIYRKVVSIPLRDNINDEVPYNIENVDSIWINESASFVKISYEVLPVNWVYSTSDYMRTWINTNLKMIRIKSPSALGGRTMYLVLEYTKTTD